MRDYKNSDHRNTWNDSAVEEHWDKVADVYVAENDKVKKSHDQRFIESVKYLDLADYLQVLNISSRDCEADDYIKKQCPGAKVLNAEISSELMKVAIKIRPGVNQQKINTYSKLPFDNNTFDRILSLETLEHVSDPVAFLLELHRVSKGSAKMVLSCPPLTSELPYRFYTAVFGGHGEGPHRFLRSSEVKAMLEKTGWHLKLHKGTVLIPAGPVSLQNWGEKIIQRFQNTFISELGIRQFFVCEKY
ncbi:MAG: methyltransferase domain-containing protein [Bacteroidales bacterium]|nr:methyltransferase domain-containing protein [Bacteroidales bacterium]MCF8402501.1 methyltransferase domain-containing protein [Bacteroidales bacterium]